MCSMTSAYPILNSGCWQNVTWARRGYDDLRRTYYSKSTRRARGVTLSSISERTQCALHLMSSDAAPTAFLGYVHQGSRVFMGTVGVCSTLVMTVEESPCTTIGAPDCRAWIKLVSVMRIVLLFGHLARFV